MIKYLRSAVTALSVTSCVLLIALWVRSMSENDLLSLGDVTAASERGRLVFYSLPNGGGPWKLEDHPRYAAVYEARPGLPVAFGDVSGGPYVTVPHWFFVFASGATALLTQWRYPYRFRLRTLLIVTTLAAVTLSLIAVLS